MPYTPPQHKLNLKELFDGLKNVSAASAEIGTFLSAHRLELVKGLREGAIEKVRTLIRDFLIDVPAAAGIVNYLMTENVDTAIGAIGMYDFALAESLRGCRENFSRLQTQWANVADKGVRG